MRKPRVLYGVFTQYEPTYKYDESLESIWDTEELAIEAKNRNKIHQHVNVRPIYINTDNFEISDEET